MIRYDFFRDEELATRSRNARLLFAGLWTIADREGRLEDKPRCINADVFPFDDDITDKDIDDMLAELSSPKSDGSHFIHRYETDGKRYIEIVNFTEHQHVHERETASAIPARKIDVRRALGAPRSAKGAPFPYTSASASASASTSASASETECVGGVGGGQTTPAAPPLASTADSGASKHADPSATPRKAKKPATAQQRSPRAMREGCVQHLDHVYLTPAEHDRLVRDYGIECVAWCIQHLDNSIPNSPAAKGYTDHNRVIRKWVVSAWKEECRRLGPAAMTKEHAEVTAKMQADREAKFAADRVKAAAVAREELVANASPELKARVAAMKARAAEADRG